ncbi:substrate-binding domain-containing protein [Bradyrhizobium sp. LHD-71]|uniref:substrate-binding domain-containing protein n=1 Tax=Bradyrhizobium sp. LHD-71 TaxID=3072141 RepID=UPI00280C7775|nr:substrate-binding domain-containing protein [Bradyrhizobium sp. LHD-71]MDQ8728515.1 substrate-binding domain-containing protein [Bradyrhizobium sp. LHD-71]
MKVMCFALAAAASVLLGSTQARCEELIVYGAGSLRAAMTAIITDFSKQSGVSIRTNFGPSGLMREKIEGGDNVDVFTSADMGHPTKLQKDGRAGNVIMFTRNRLCAFATPDAGLTTSNFATRLADPAVRLGTSTPAADPSGDYTWEMFRLIDKVQPGAFAVLDAKAKKVVGGSAEANPSDPDPIGSAFKRGDINVMIAYCSGTAERRRVLPDVQVIQVPAAIAVGPEYGLAILNPAKLAAARLVFAILSPEGQATLARFGFDPVALPKGAPAR